MAKKEKPVYRLFCEYHHDSAACQRALRTLQAIPLTPEEYQKAEKEWNQCESSAGTSSDPGECGEKKEV